MTTEQATQIITLLSSIDWGIKLVLIGIMILAADKLANRIKP